MRPFVIASCMLALYAPARALAQEAGDSAASYGEFFGEAGGEKESPSDSPHSLAEARKQGKGFRLGASGSIYRKPERDIYRLALETTQFSRGECCFLDDRSLNLECAAQMGMHTIQVQSLEQMKGELAKLGVTA